MPRHPGRIWCGTSDVPYLAELLDPATAGCEGWCLLRTPFPRISWLIQGNPLSPTVFNVVVDAVIWHWVTVVAPTEAGAEVLGDTIQDLAEFFYLDDGLVAWHRRG